jgi:glyoxylate reductase
MKVFITQELPGNVEELLSSKGFEVDVYRKNNIISKRELIKRAKDADGLICLLTNTIDRHVIDSLDKCKVIANVAVGYNNIDAVYAKSKNIVVTNTPGILDDATADLTLALILACARRLREGDIFVRKNKFKAWMPQLMLGIELSGKTVGIIGAGRIGIEVAKRLLPFKTKIIYSDRNRREKFESVTGAKKVSLNELLKKSDIVSLHLPLNKESFHILNRENMKLMKPTSILVNTSRGEVVEENYLIEILKKKKIFAAGLDVYEGEPKINQELFKLDNAFLLPHIGSATIETRSKMAQLAAKNVAAVLSNKKPVTPV